MNSRERVQLAINPLPLERCPIDSGGIRASGINAVVHDTPKKRLDIKTSTKIHDTMHILAGVNLQVAEHLHVDVLPPDAADVEEVADHE